MPHNVDQQVLQVFQDEVRAALPKLKKYLDSLSKNPSRREALKKAHSLVQGLSGTASLIGLATWSETGSAVGYFLAEVVAGEETMTADAATELRSILDHIDAELDLPVDLDPPRFELEDMDLDVSLDAPLPDVASEANDALRIEILDIDEPAVLAEEATPSPADDSGELPADELGDPEIVEVFQEEAEELLGLIATSLRTLQDEPANRDVLQEVRRAMHTIKGAAGMVGLRSAQRVAHRSEDLLDYLYDSKTPVSADMIGLLQVTADLVQDIAEAAGTSDTTRAAVIECCTQYTQVLTKIKLAPPTTTSTSVPSRPSEDNLEEDTPCDAELVEVFQEEAEEHLGLVAKNLRALRKKPTSRELLQEVRRSMHTIKSAAGMVGLRSAQRVAHRSEDLLDQLYDSHTPLEADVLDLIQDTAELIQTVTEASGADAAARQRVLELIALYDAPLASLSAKTPEPVEAAQEDHQLQNRK